jgi:hypothetical protein
VAEPGSNPDLTGLQPTYRVTVRRSVAWLYVVVFTLVAISAVLRLVNDPDAVGIGLSVVQLVCYGYMLFFYTGHPPALFVTSTGLRFRRFLRTGPLLPWAAIREVRVQGRWDEHSSVITDDGRTLRLTAMPAEDAQRLATALGAAGS